ncbi:MAG TPA: hypothetical protein VF964_00665, partial [Vicinamibacteria bacterium]
IPREDLEVTGAWRRPEARQPRRAAPEWAPRGQETAGGAPAPPAPAGGAEMRPGVRVRHPLFGVGTVLRRDGEGDELKLTVAFAGVGAKKLVARYAGLQLV